LATHVQLAAVKERDGTLKRALMSEMVVPTIETFAACFFLEHATVPAAASPSSAPGAWPSLSVALVPAVGAWQLRWKCWLGRRRRCRRRPQSGNSFVEGFKFSVAIGERRRHKPQTVPPPPRCNMPTALERQRMIIDLCFVPLLHLCSEITASLSPIGVTGRSAQVIVFALEGRPSVHIEGCHRGRAGLGLEIRRTPAKEVLPCVLRRRRISIQAPFEVQNGDNMVGPRVIIVGNG